MPVPRAARWALLAGACALALTACSAHPGADPSDPAEAVRAAATRTAATPVGVTVDGAGPARGHAVHTTGTGTVDPARRVANLDLEIADLGRVQARLLGSTAYAALPPRAVGNIADGRPWVSVELPTVDRGLFADTLVQLGTGVTGNPADGLGLLAAVRDVRVTAQEPVARRPTTHYTGAVDLARASAAAPALGPVLGRFTNDVSVARLPVEVWVDTTGRVRRLVEHLSPVATSTLELGDPVAPPAVAAPPAARVTDLLASLRP